ncbi:MAG: SHOCT domain-containing protein [Clostridia bacterium]|nr:SHOCT domain-containing protein [Clostridia bacterium]
MFDNIGTKIKKLALVTFWVGVVASAFLGLSLLIWSAERGGGSWLVGLIIVAVGCLISWIGCFALYGYGELIEKTAAIYDNTRLSGSASTQGSDKSTKAAFLGELRNSGVLTEEEYKRKLNELFGSNI